MVLPGAVVVVDAVQPLLLRRVLFVFLEPSSLSLQFWRRFQWWGYLHQNGTLQLKRWFGDHQDYTTDCEGNDFVLQVVPPFKADSREEAMQILAGRVKC